jgi:PAS domain S-box-containing protein
MVDFSSAKFLVVDDDCPMLDQMCRILSLRFPGCCVVRTIEGKSAVDAALKEKPDVILLDAKLPGIDGFEVCRILKQEQSTAHIPIVIISGVRKDNESRNLAIEIGADDYLFKPFSADELYFHVRVLLRIKRTEDILRGEKQNIEELLAVRTNELCANQQYLKDLIDTLPEPVFETDKTLRITFLNNAARTLLGYENENAIHNLYLSDVIAFNMRQAQAHIQKVLAGEKIAPYEYVAIRNNGLKFLARISFAAIIRAGKIEGTRGVLFDITDIKLLEQQLIESREQQRQLFKNMSDAFMVGEALLDEQGRAKDFKFIDVNPAFEEMSGLSASDVAGKTLLELIPAAEQKCIEHLCEVAISRNSLKLESYSEELGRYLNVSIFSPQKGIAAAVLSDITARRINEEKEAELREKNKRLKQMELLAALARGISHELNNILGPVVCYPDLIINELPTDSDAKEDVMAIKTAAERAVRVIEDLSCLGKSGLYKQETCSFVKLIDDVVEASNTTINIKKESFSGKKRSKQEEDFVYCYSPHFKKMISILFETAAEIAGREKSLSIGIIKKTLVQPQEGYMETIPVGEYMRLRIAIPNIQLTGTEIANLFEPFAKINTASNQYSHNGIGLPLALSIAKAHNAHIQILSGKRIDTQIMLYMPLASEKIGEEQKIKSSALKRKTGKILVVDDMKMQRSIAKKILSSLGFDVETAATGREAISLLKKNGTNKKRSPYDLVLVDMMLEEDFDGLNTIEAIKAKFPNQKFIIASGYARSERVQMAEQLGVRDFIRKPYFKEQMEKIIYKVMSGF